ncbi:bifunctional polysaccharide deacetylase/glycosyltransferase family 2 protein [Actinopolymorpha sp. B17G11]|uniref:bifunctional polysaccharide deacetylase/glycosyltransferase family 2 protein n=1 Tax=Actinopolymorpha sp. B17G11 TaxID=3160861 RepID=UPI0032E4DF7E
MARHVRLREPRHHWTLICLLLASLAAVLLVHGYVEKGSDGQGYLDEAWSSSTAPSEQSSSTSPLPLSYAGPILDLSRSRPARTGMPHRTIALTFEDGPDPRWTPQVLAVLRRHGVRATFFVVGSKAAAHPELTRRILAEGHEIGSHTYTHADLGGIPGWRRAVELTLAQRALAGTTGMHTYLLRPPHTSTPSRLTGPEYEAARDASRQGYLIVLTDRDTRDASRRTTKQIVAAATPKAGRGAVVRLHDGGGDRSAVVEGVDRLITRLQPKKYRFTTVSDALHLREANTPAGMVDRSAGAVLVGAQRAGKVAAEGLTMATVAAGVLTVGRLVLMVLLAWRHEIGVRRARARVLRAQARALRAQARALRSRSRAVRLRTHGARTRAARARERAYSMTTKSRYHPPVSVIVPAYNEAAGITATLRSLVASDYPGDLEVVVVDDGSTDNTAAIASRLGLPEVRVIRQRNAGKASALNTGISYSRHDVLVMVDGDTVFEPTTIRRLVQPLADPEVGAVSGNTKVGNRRGVLGRWQHLEYVIGFNLDRRMFDLLECMPTVPGAIGAFRYEALASVGWISDDTLAEDTDLTMALCRVGWRVVYKQSARAWTEAPASLAQLWRQRYRWCYGTLQSMWKHRRALFERGPAGRFGRRGLSYLAVFQVALPLFAPAIDVFALYAVLFGRPSKVLGVWLTFVLLQMVVGGYALRLDRERLTALWTMPLQQFVYRQLMYMVVIQSVVTAVLGAPLRWHTMRREGTFAHSQVSAVQVRSRG